MLTNLKKSTNVTAQSVVTVSNETVVVAVLTASISEEGVTSSNRLVQHKELFESNKESVLKDFQEFDDYIYRL